MKKQLPCYDTRKTAPLTIEWDGNTDGKEFFYHPQFEINYYKFSETVPTAEEIQQGEGVFYVSAAGEDGFTEEFQFTFAEKSRLWTDESGNIAYAVTLEQIGGLVLIVVLNELIIPAWFFDNETEIHLTKGMWSFCDHEPVEGNETHAFTKRLYFPSVATGELKTLDPKYLPNQGVTLYGNTENNRVYTTSDISDASKMLTFNELKGMFESWCPIRIMIDAGGETVYFSPSAISFTDTLGKICADAMGGSLMFYTAEYTGTTT